MLGMLSIGSRVFGLLVALVVAASIAGCGDDEEAAPNPEPTAPSPMTISPSLPAATPTPGELSLLADALGDDELLARRPLAKPNLVYAVKMGERVVVYKRSMTTGDQTVLLEYDEVVEAAHLRDIWPEFPPSAALAYLVPSLVYVDGDEVITYDLESGTSTTLLTKLNEGRDRGGGSLEAEWMASNGTRLCCAYALHTPVVSSVGSRIALSMAQWEGGSLTVLTTDGAVACILPNEPNSGAISSNNPMWNSAGDLLLRATGGDLAGGLFVSNATDLCAPVELTSQLIQDEGRYDTANWSPDDQRIAVSSQVGVVDPTTVSLLTAWRDGSDSKELVAEGLNYWPIFEADGRSLAFIQRTAPLHKEGSESLWEVDTLSGERRRTADVPTGWSIRPLGVTEEGYLALVAHTGSCPYPRKCSDRLLVVDVQTGDVVYASADPGVVTFLGFLP